MVTIKERVKSIYLGLPHNFNQLFLIILFISFLLTLFYSFFFKISFEYFLLIMVFLVFLIITISAFIEHLKYENMIPMLEYHRIKTFMQNFLDDASSDSNKALDYAGKYNFITRHRLKGLAYNSNNYIIHAIKKLDQNSYRVILIDKELTKNFFIKKSPNRRSKYYIDLNYGYKDDLKISKVH